MRSAQTAFASRVKGEPCQSSPVITEASYTPRTDWKAVEDQEELDEEGRQFSVSSLISHAVLFPEGARHD